MTEQDLTFVRLAEDGSRLVLVSDAGAEFTLTVDQRLRSALGGEAIRNGRLEKTMESTLRPRDIQARIRAGESPENVAAAAQTSVERIMSYATPVLAERAHIADRAQRASVRRKGGDSPARLLGDAVSERLRGRNVDPGSVAWDAWRREDGRWTLVADYDFDGTGNRAEFVFDAPGRYVVPEDDTARWLVGEQPTAARPAPVEPDAQALRRLAPVADEELPLGEDAIGMVTAAPAAPGEPALVREHPAPADPAAETGDADWIATQASDRPVAPAPETTPEPEPAPEPEPEPAAAEPEPEQQPRRPVKKNRGRASVPSWDEIMFGGGRSE